MDYPSASPYHQIDQSYQNLVTEKYKTADHEDYSRDNPGRLEELLALGPGDLAKLDTYFAEETAQRLYPGPLLFHKMNSRSRTSSTPATGLAANADTR